MKFRASRILPIRCLIAKSDATDPTRALASQSTTSGKES